MQEALAGGGTYPVLALAEQLGVADRLVHPEALERGVFRFDRKLKRHWGAHFVSARLEYGVFVPAELEPHVATPER